LPCHRREKSPAIAMGYAMADLQTFDLIQFAAGTLLLLS